MLHQVRNFELVKDQERTYLTAAVAVAATTLTVRAVDTNAWADNDYIIVGEIGSKTAEVLQVNGAVADGTSLTIDNNGSGGARFAHAINEPVYRIRYNRIEFSHSATDSSGASSVLATNEIQPDDLFTRFEDTTNTTGFGFVRFNNQTSGVFSSFSDGVPYSGFTARSLGRIQKAVRTLLGEPDFKFLEDEEIRDSVNGKQRDVGQERLWPFFEDIFSTSSVAFQRDYPIDSGVVVGKAHLVTFKTQILGKIDSQRFNLLHWDTAITGDPTHVLTWQNSLRFYPIPSTAAQTNAINDVAGITAAAVTITVDSTSGFSPTGRIIIDSEVMEYTNLTTTSFRGVTRGLEGTTAATHANDATITERDIIYPAHAEPTEMIDNGDETNIPDPSILEYGAAMDLAIGKMKDQTLHDRLKLKYDEAIQRLRDKFGKKMTFSYYTIKDKTEVISDRSSFRDPNDFPTNITAV